MLGGWNESRKGRGGALRTATSVQILRVLVVDGDEGDEGAMAHLARFHLLLTLPG